MRSLGEYIVSVTAAAFVCGIVNGMMPKGTAKEILKLVGGLFLAFTVIHPISDLQIPDMEEIGASFREEASAAAELGESLSAEKVQEGIRQQLEAYILDKAQDLHLDLAVELVLMEDNSMLPERVIIRGNASPYAKLKLTAQLCEELGISEEDIQWTG